MRNLMKNVLMAGAGLSMLTLAACSSNCVNVQYVPGMNSAKKVGGGMLSHNVKISNLYLKQQKNDLFRAQATLTNLTDERQSMRYRISWMTGEGQQQGYYTPWAPVVLYPKLSQVVSAVSPSKESSNFAVQVCYVEQD